MGVREMKLVGLLVVAGVLGCGGDDGVHHLADAPPIDTAELVVAKTGNGSGTVSGPEGIACGSTCAADLPIGTSITLTAEAADGTAVDRLLALTGDYESAAALALTAGVDISLWDKAFSTLEQAVLQGKVQVSFIDRAVRRVLQLKFQLGLFENPYTAEESAAEIAALVFPSAVE